VLHLDEKLDEACVNSQPFWRAVGKPAAPSVHLLRLHHLIGAYSHVSHDANFSALQPVGCALLWVDRSVSLAHQGMLLRRLSDEISIPNLCIASGCSSSCNQKDSMPRTQAVLGVACHFTKVQAYAGTHVALAGSHTETLRAKKGGVQRRSLTTKNNQNSPKEQSASRRCQPGKPELV
jgi:hypothetical protein